MKILVTPKAAPNSKKVFLLKKAYIIVNSLLKGYIKGPKSYLKLETQRSNLI